MSPRPHQNTDPAPLAVGLENWNGLASHPASRTGGARRQLAQQFCSLARKKRQRSMLRSATIAARSSAPFGGPDMAFLTYIFLPVFLREELPARKQRRQLDWALHPALLAVACYKRSWFSPQALHALLSVLLNPQKVKTDLYTWLQVSNRR